MSMNNVRPGDDGLDKEALRRSAKEARSIWGDYAYVDTETSPLFGFGIWSDYVKEATRGLPPHNTLVPRKQNRPFPGLARNRRVVLDLTFRGYGISGEIVDKDGELLGIVDPRTPRFDPVPGAVVVMMDLGVALKKLTDKNRKYDLIVADIPPDSQCPAVGAFAPPRAPQARTGRKLLLANTVAREVPIVSVDLAKSVLDATERLMSDSGEALLRMHAIAFNKFCKSNHPLLKHVWFAHVRNNLASIDVYAARSHVSENRTCRSHAPEWGDRAGALPPALLQWTSGQRIGFGDALR